MSLKEIASALQRARSVLERRPGKGLHDDPPATARWCGGTRTVASHANGTRVETDMATELGGTGDRVSPGWMFRAGVASCAATTIAMAAALEGVDLAELEVQAGSSSDTRGLLGMREASGEPVFAGPAQVRLHVRIAADGVERERLRDLVERSLRQSPIPNAVQSAIPFGVQLEIETR